MAIKKKTEDLRVRVTPELRQWIVAIADQAEESEASIIREAIREYVTSRTSSAEGKIASLREDAAQYGAGSVRKVIGPPISQTPTPKPQLRAKSSG